jgi:hypothetical protein
MRCYFMRDGHIQAVEVLRATSDEAAIKEAHELFRHHSARRFVGFEVWDQARFVHRYSDS